MGVMVVSAEGSFRCRSWTPARRSAQPATGWSWLGTTGLFASRTTKQRQKAVAAVNFARPNFVERRAKAGILAQFQSAHAAAEIALGGFSGLVDRADDRHRFVLTVLALGDELSFWVFPKGSKAGTFRSMRPRRSSSADSRASSIVPVSVHAPQLITPKVARIQAESGGPTKKSPPRPERLHVPKCP